MRFDNLPFDGKAPSLAEPTQTLHDVIIVQLLGGTAIVADHELALVRIPNIAAGNKRTGRLDLVDELVREQEIERPVDGGWPELPSAALQLGEQRISPDRLIRRQNQFEDLSAHSRQARAAHRADQLCTRECAFNFPKRPGKPP